jgi:hypothetical protein
MFGFIAAVLLLAFLVGVDWGSDFRAGMTAGSVFYFALTAVAALVAAWGNSIVMRRGGRGEIRFVTAIFGIPIRVKTMAVADVRTVTLQGVRFLKESEQPRPGLGVSRFSSYMAKRNTYYKLFFDTDQGRTFIEDSTDASELEDAATRISGFLGVDFRKEDI